MVKTYGKETHRFSTKGKSQKMVCVRVRGRFEYLWRSRVSSSRRWLLWSNTAVPLAQSFFSEGGFQGSLRLSVRERSIKSHLWITRKKLWKLPKSFFFFLSFYFKDSFTLGTSIELFSRSLRRCGREKGWGRVSRGGGNLQSPLNSLRNTF